MGDAMLVLIGAPLFLLAAAIPFLRLISLWSEGLIDGPTSISGFALLVIVMAAVIAGPGPLKLLAMGVVFGGALILPAVGRAQEAYGARRISDDRLDAYIGALDENPMNHAARLALATELGRRDHYDQAIEHLEWLAREAPRLHPTVQPRLAMLQRARDRARQGGGPFFCHRCREECMPGTRRCPACGVAFEIGPDLRAGFRSAGGAMAVLRTWIVLGVAIPLVVFALLEMDAVYAAAVTAATVMVTAWLFLRWVGGDAGLPSD